MNIPEPNKATCEYWHFITCKFWNHSGFMTKLFCFGMIVDYPSTFLHNWNDCHRSPQSPYKYQKLFHAELILMSPQSTVHHKKFGV